VQEYSNTCKTYILRIWKDSLSSGINHIEIIVRNKATYYLCALWQILCFSITKNGSVTLFILYIQQDVREWLKWGLWHANKLQTDRRSWAVTWLSAYVSWDRSDMVSMDQRSKMLNIQIWWDLHAAYFHRVSYIFIYKLCGLLILKLATINRESFQKCEKESLPTESLNNKNNTCHCPKWRSPCDLMLHNTLLRVYRVKQHCVGNNMEHHKIKQISWPRLMASTTRVSIIFSIPLTYLFYLC
jgi:hypothetical protein